MSTSQQKQSFATTRWSLVAAAGGPSSSSTRAALEDLCSNYWYPLYAFVRRKGHSREEAQDLTQAFFAELLEKERLQVADGQRGRFRSFLLASFNHFVTNQWRAGQAKKRGGYITVKSIDFMRGEARYQQEPSHSLTAEKIYERRWAMTLLESSIDAVATEYKTSGKADLFEALKGHIGGDVNRIPYRDIATQLGLSEGAIKVAAHRFRKRCRELLRQEIAQTVAEDSEIDDELSALFDAIAIE